MWLQGYTQSSQNPQHPSAWGTFPWDRGAQSKGSVKQRCHWEMEMWKGLSLVTPLQNKIWGLEEHSFSVGLEPIPSRKREEIMEIMEIMGQEAWEGLQLSTFRIPLSQESAPPQLSQCTLIQRVVKAPQRLYGLSQEILRTLCQPFQKDPSGTQWDPAQFPLCSPSLCTPVARENESSVAPSARAAQPSIPGPPARAPKPLPDPTLRAGCHVCLRFVLPEGGRKLQPDAESPSRLWSSASTGCVR